MSALKTTSYYIDDTSGLVLSQRGNIWTIGADTADGVIEFEISAKAACAVREFFADAVCAECKPTPEPEPQPAPEPEPVVDLMAALKASVEAARKRREEDHR